MHRKFDYLKCPKKIEKYVNSTSTPIFYLHPNIPLSRDRWTKHMMVLGAIGGGKSTLMKFVLHQVVEANDKALILDIKGDYTAMLGNALLIAPWDKRGWVWDIGKDIRTKQDARDFTARIIEESKDPMWANSARMILVSFIVACQHEKGTDWGWIDLVEMMKTPEDELKDLMLKYNPEGLRAVENQNATTSGIMINLSAFVMIIYDMADAWKNPNLPKFSIKEWLYNDESEVRQVVVQGNMEFESVTKGIVGAITGYITSKINSPTFSDSTTRRLWFFFDEAPIYGKLNIEPLIAIGRSKGLRVIIGAQDLNQLRKVYSQEEANAWMSMVGTTILAKVNAGDTAKWISETVVGTREIERANWSKTYQADGASSTFMYNRETQPVITPDELVSKLGVTQGGVNIMVLGTGNAYIIKSPFINYPKARKESELNAWALGEKEVIELSSQQEGYNLPDDYEYEVEIEEDTDDGEYEDIYLHEDELLSESQLNKIISLEAMGVTPLFERDDEESKIITSRNKESDLLDGVPDDIPNHQIVKPKDKIIVEVREDNDVSPGVALDQFIAGAVAGAFAHEAELAKLGVEMVDSLMPNKTTKRQKNLEEGKTAYQQK